MLPWLPLLGLLALALGPLAGCTTVPETGRKQVMLVSGPQEVQLGLTSFDKVKKDQPISRDAAANALVQKVGSASPTTTSRRAVRMCRPFCARTRLMKPASASLGSCCRGPKRSTKK
jgi:hypothetical protein